MLGPGEQYKALEYLDAPKYRGELILPPLPRQNITPITPFSPPSFSPSFSPPLFSSSAYTFNPPQLPAYNPPQLPLYNPPFSQQNSGETVSIRESELVEMLLSLPEDVRREIIMKHPQIHKFMYLLT